MDTAISSGQLLLAVPVALLAGLISFASPCILPLVPGYLGYVGAIGGATGDRPGAPASTRRLVVGVALFVLGFSLVFVVLGYLVGAAGFFLVQWRDPLTRAAGVLVLLFGIVFIGGIGPLQRIVRPAWRPRTGIAGAPILGALFAFGWTPCLGPTLTAIDALALQSGSAPQGALLAFVYSMGLGVPFLAIALGLGWATRTFAFLKRHVRLLNLVGGAALIAIGVLMVSGLWLQATTQLQGMWATFVPAL
jgi:cytochrome c-type biogenesis protein